MFNQKYSVGKIKYEELKNNIVLPKFQRNLVWSEREKINFIESLKKGYPFGSILIYKYKDEKSTA